MKSKSKDEQGYVISTKREPLKPSPKVSVITPKCFRDIERCIDCLKCDEQVVVELAFLSSDSANKALNVLSGAVYALNGSMKRLKDKMYLLTASGIPIVGE